MARLMMSDGAVIEERAIKLEERQSMWSMYAPLASALMAMVPAMIAIKESRASTSKEKMKVGKSWKNWHIWAAVIGGGLALVPGYFAYEELRLKRLKRKMMKAKNGAVTLQ